MSRETKNSDGYLLVICASDSRGGAGLQAALAQAAMCELECRSVVTAVTAQSQFGVSSVSILPVGVVESQLHAALQDGSPSAVLLGWLPPETGLIRVVRDFLASIEAPVVWDPVITATLGRLPGGDGAAVALYRTLLPYITVLTPTLSEAKTLAGDGASPDDPRITTAKALQRSGVHTVLISGGDEPPDVGVTEARVTDIVVSQPNASQPETMVLPEFAVHQTRLNGSAHGTGSQQSAGIAVSLALGERLYDAIIAGAVAAHAALGAAHPLKNSDPAVRGYANCRAVHKPTDGEHWPLVTDVDKTPENAHFERYSPGLYALTDNLEHLRSLLSLGIDTVQWRVKNPGPTHNENTLEAMRLCQSAGVGFWLNDDWKLALSLGCSPDASVDSSLRPDGVHLGQEDLISADITALRDAGLSLGISTHTEWEIARARALNPGYIAFGPVFTPLSKTLQYSPLGTDQLAKWRNRYRAWSQTCIGGIVPENAGRVAATGIGSMAVVTCLQPGQEQAANARVLREALLNA